MSNDTWLDFGTLVEAQKRKIGEYKDANTQQAAVIAALTAELNATKDRLAATKEARKKEKLRWLGLGPKEEKTHDEQV